MDPTREDLEEQARRAICVCYYYDFEPELHSDDELRHIIANPKWAHFENYRHATDMTEEDLEEELRDCSG